MEILNPLDSVLPLTASGYIDLYGFSFLRTTPPSPPTASSIGPTLDEVTSVGCPQSGSDLQKGEVSIVGWAQMATTQSCILPSSMEGGVGVSCQVLPTVPWAPESYN